MPWRYTVVEEEKEEMWLWNSRNDLLQDSYPYTHSLLRGVTFEALPLSSCALSPTMLPQLKKVLELMLWNNFQCLRHIFFFGCLQYPEIFVPLKQTLFLETARSHSEPYQGIGWVFHFSSRILGQKLLDRSSLMSWGLVIVENPVVGLKFRHFSTHSFT